MEEKKTPVVEQCKGCTYVQEDQLCKVYYWPDMKWGDSRKCPMCSTTAKEVVQEKKALDPIKASKRMVKGK
jgi:hypothetical protein